MLRPAFSALYHVGHLDSATFGEWIEMSIAVAHLHVLASSIDEYEPVCNLFGVVFGAMAVDAHDWYETGERPRADTWYLPLLPWMMRAYKRCCKRALPTVLAATRSQAEERLCGRLFR